MAKTKDRSTRWKCTRRRNYSSGGVRFEQYAKMGFHIEPSEIKRIAESDVYWLAWEVTRRSGESVKPFGMDFIETLKSVEVLDSDPLA
jgi:hypothetical protein